LFVNEQMQSVKLMFRKSAIGFKDLKSKIDIEDQKAKMGMQMNAVNCCT